MPKDEMSDTDSSHFVQVVSHYDGGKFTVESITPIRAAHQTGKEAPDTVEEKSSASAEQLVDAFGSACDDHSTTSDEVAAIRAALVRERDEARAALAKAESDAAALHDGATWYAYAPETGYDTFGTAAEAQRAAKESIDEYREGSGDGWDEGVEQVEWGLAIPLGAVVQTNVVDTPDSPMGFDFICDYELKSNDSASAVVLARLCAAEEKAASEPARIAAAEMARDVAWVVALLTNNQRIAHVAATALGISYEAAATHVSSAATWGEDIATAIRAARGAK